MKKETPLQKTAKQIELLSKTQCMKCSYCTHTFVRKESNDFCDLRIDAIYCTRINLPVSPWLASDYCKNYKLEK